MALSPEEVAHIARLAHIALNEHEKEAFRHDLSAMLAFIGQLNELDTELVEPLTGGTDLETIMRPDAREDASLEGISTELIAAAPDRQHDLIRVPSVFE